MKILSCKRYKTTCTAYRPCGAEFIYLKKDVWRDDDSILDIVTCPSCDGQVSVNLELDEIDSDGNLVYFSKEAISRREFSAENDRIESEKIKKDQEEDAKMSCLVFFIVLGIVILCVMIHFRFF